MGAQSAVGRVRHAETKLSIFSKPAEHQLRGHCLRQARRARDPLAYGLDGPRDRRRERGLLVLNHPRRGTEPTDDEQNRTRWEKPQREANRSDDGKRNQKQAALRQREVEEGLKSHSRYERRPESEKAITAATHQHSLSEPL